MFLYRHKDKLIVEGYNVDRSLLNEVKICLSIFAKRTKIAKFRYLRKARSSKGIRLLIVFCFKTVQNVNPLYFLC